MCLTYDKKKAKMSLECKKKICIPIQESEPMLDRYILVEVCCIKHEAMSCDCLWGKLKTDFRAFARVLLEDQHLSSSTWNSNLLKIHFHLYQSRNSSKSKAQYYIQTTTEKKQQSKDWNNHRTWNHTPLHDLHIKLIKSLAWICKNTSNVLY